MPPSSSVQRTRGYSSWRHRRELGCLERSHRRQPRNGWLLSNSTAREGLFGDTLSRETLCVCLSHFSDCCVSQLCTRCLRVLFCVCILCTCTRHQHLLTSYVFFKGKWWHVVVYIMYNHALCSDIYGTGKPPVTLHATFLYSLVHNYNNCTRDYMDMCKLKIRKYKSHSSPFYTSKKVVHHA